MTRTITALIVVPLLTLNFLFLADTIREHDRVYVFKPDPMILPSQEWVEPLIDTHIEQLTDWKKGDYFISFIDRYRDVVTYYAINKNDEFVWPEQGTFIVFYINYKTRVIDWIRRHDKPGGGGGSVPAE